MYIDRQEFLEEMKLRKLVREAANIILERNHKDYIDELKLRKLVRNMILETAAPDADTQPAPKRSTAMNILADTLNIILPIVKPNFRKLTSEPEGGNQRISYRDHIIQSTQDFLDTLNAGDGQSSEAEDNKTIMASPDDAADQPVEDEVDELFEADIQVNVDDGDDEDPDLVVPDIEKEKPKKKSKEEKEDEEFESFKISGKDGTGARLAFSATNSSNFFDAINKSWKILDNADERKKFEDYLIYNLDLWLTKYEKELADELGIEPAFTDPSTKAPSDLSASEPEESPSVEPLEEDDMIEYVYSE